MLTCSFTIKTLAKAVLLLDPPFLPAKHVQTSMNTGGCQRHAAGALLAMENLINKFDLHVSTTNTTSPSSPLPPSFDALLLPVHSPAKHALTICAKVAGVCGNFPRTYTYTYQTAQAARKFAVHRCVLMMFHEHLTLVFVNCTDLITYMHPISLSCPPPFLFAPHLVSSCSACDYH